MTELEKLLQKEADKIAVILAKKYPNVDPKRIGEAAKKIVLEAAKLTAEIVTKDNQP